MEGGIFMLNKKVITGLKIGAFVATFGLSILSKWIETKEQEQEIEKAVGTYYNGATLSGINTNYASDKNWSNRVYSYMQYLYGKL